MKKLSKTQFERARKFLCTDARELEGAIYRYEFEQGSQENVLTQLKSFQNEDGGFGHGLEPDIRTHSSSALATTVAIQHLSQIAPSDQKDELIKDCLRYFENTFNSDIKGWEIIPKEAEQAPRAIWWNYSEENAHWGNPNAEILAYLIQYAHLASEGIHTLSRTLLDYAITYLQHESDRKEMHELFCFIKLYDVLPVEQKDELDAAMEQFIQQCVVKQPDERNGYCTVPLQIVTSPQSIYYSLFEEVIPYDLDQLIDGQTEQGTWEPNWSWGRYEEEWSKAKKEWTGIITLQNLRILKAFDRIELS